jgi:hypothetical protein
MCKLPKNLSFFKGTRSNFYKHYQRAHEKHQSFEDFCRIEAEEKRKKGSDQNSSATATAVKVHDRKKLIEMISSCLVVKCALPFSIVENSGFLEFVEYVNIQSSCSKIQ